MPENPVNVLVVVLDTVRAKSTYVNGRDITPNLEQLANDGASFERAITPAPWTFPAHASMFTGLYPTEHGATQMTRTLPDDHTTLPQQLKAAGYTTGLFSANGFLTDTYDMTRGFETSKFVRSDTDKLFEGGIDPIEFMRNHPGSFGYEDVLLAIREGPPVRTFGNFIYYKLLKKSREFRYDTNTPLHRWDDVVVDQATEFIKDASAGSEPFFAFVNLIEAHAPWQYDRSVVSESGVEPEDIAPESRWRDVANKSGKKFEYATGNITFDEVDQEILTRLYESWVHRVDSLAGDLVRTVDSLNIRDETVILLTSDHGEVIAKNDDIGHTTSVSEDVAHIPLAISGPMTPSKSFRQPVSLKDVYGTILEQTTPSPTAPTLFEDGAQGKALIETSGPHTEEREKYCENAPWLWGKKRALYTSDGFVEQHYFTDVVVGDDTLLDELETMVEAMDMYDCSAAMDAGLDDQGVKGRLENLGYM